MTPEPGVLEFLENPANLRQAIENAPEGDVHWVIAEKKRRDNVRMLISLGALSILAGTIGLTFAAAWGGKQPLTWANWGPIAGTLFAAEFAILGSIVAFYMSKD
jgi:hypothetical protein